jgi:hypothetical protein
MEASGHSDVAAPGVGLRHVAFSCWSDGAHFQFKSQNKLKKWRSRIGSSLWEANGAIIKSKKLLDEKKNVTERHFLDGFRLDRWYGAIVSSVVNKERSSGTWPRQIITIDRRIHASRRRALNYYCSILLPLSQFLRLTRIPRLSSK